MLPLNDRGFKVGLAEMPDCYRCDRGLEETVRLLPLSAGAPILRAFRRVGGSYRSLTSRVRLSRVCLRQCVAHVAWGGTVGVSHIASHTKYYGGCG